MTQNTANTVLVSPGQAYTFTRLQAGTLKNKFNLSVSDRGAMLAHCVNPACDAPLSSFSEGRLFQFEIVSISISATDDAREPFDEKPNRQTAHYWLCGRCAGSMALVLEPLRGLRLVPLETGEAGASDRKEVPVDRPQPPNRC